MVYSAGKLIENLKLFYKSNRPHFLLVYLRDNPRGMLGEHEKSLQAYKQSSELEYKSTLTFNWVLSNKLRRIYKHFILMHPCNNLFYLSKLSTKYCLLDR